VADALERYHGFFQRRFVVVLGVGAWLILAGAVTGLTLGRSITRPLANVFRLAPEASKIPPDSIRVRPGPSCPSLSVT